VPIAGIWQEEAVIVSSVRLCAKIITAQSSKGVALFGNEPGLQHDGHLACLTDTLQVVRQSLALH
jgi:pyruvate-formate lyase-activating enzyme